MVVTCNVFLLADISLSGAKNSRSLKRREEMMGYRVAEEEEETMGVSQNPKSGCSAQRGGLRTMPFIIVAEEEDETVGVSQNPKTECSAQRGGLRTMPFIIVNESFERLASYGLAPNMILYMMNGYHMNTVTSSTILSLWSASSNFLSILGAYLSDSYLGRYRVIGLGSICSSIGATLLWLTTMVPQARPSLCSSGFNTCTATPTQLAILLTAFGLMSIGAGCIRPCSIAFGADQLVKQDDREGESILSSYFNWYNASIGVSSILALSFIVYIQDNLGWQVGFGVPANLMFLSAVFFFAGSSFYIKVETKKSLFIGLVQVVVVAFKNRNLVKAPANLDWGYYHNKDSNFTVPSDHLRCLNKACIIRDPEEEFKPNGPSSNPWELCNVDQVEELKSLVRILPIWSTGIIMFLTLSQTITVLQANTMNRHVTSTFQIPAGSYILFTVVTLTILLPFYDRVFVPLLSKYTGHPRGIRCTQRIGIGLVLSCMAMAVAAIMENVRRGIAIREGFLDNPTAVIGMSAMWLIPQFVILGFAEALNSVGQLEFYYSQLPKSLGSMAMAFFTVGMAFSGLLGSLITIIVNAVTSSGGKLSWLSSNLNRGRYDYYYWLLAVLSFLNFLYFLVCCRLYGPYEEASTISDKKEYLKEGLLSKSREFPGSSA
ncbi:hypothetical protein GIB67_011066 [Kingdonia uniflora]|uniref:Uncharacterized protein n=1 Tax=Kingdonia uniflora TaxID=39325 RepID=A0A7J7L6F3_9MAGN|nr:hypothetical protein GIB67_011066 [Kingdonia uniflora]